MFWLMRLKNNGIGASLPSKPVCYDIIIPLFMFGPVQPKLPARGAVGTYDIGTGDFIELPGNYVYTTGVKLLGRRSAVQGI